MKEKIEQIEKQLDELYPIGKGGYILIAYDEDGHLLQQELTQQINRYQNYFIILYNIIEA